jgi:drug/metabolite transporter (DMT)-like permease
MTTDKAKGTIYVLICIFLWSILAPVAKYAQTNLDNHQFLFYSSLISFLALFITASIKNRVEYIKKYSLKDWIIVSILGLLGTYIYYLLLYLGYKEAKGLEVLVVQYLWPIMIVVISLFLLNEKLTIKKSLSVVLGFIGVSIVLTKGDISQIHIDNIDVIFLVFIGASSFALFSVLSKKVNYEAVSVTAMYFLVATVASFISMIYSSEFVIPKFNEMIPILINGILINGFSYLFWLKALKFAEASYIAPFVFIAPVLSAIYIIILFDEGINIAYLFGIVSVVLAGVINSI